MAIYLAIYLESDWQRTFHPVVAAGGTGSVFMGCGDPWDTSRMEPQSLPKPLYVQKLEQSFGPPSQSAFGSAVFFEPSVAAADLEKSGLAKYRHFCGQTWERFGEKNWLNSWQQVYLRESQSKREIVSELHSIEDRDARNSVSMLLDNAASHDALRTAFDNSQVSEMRVFKIGDGNAMSGLLVAALRPEGAVFLVFLLD